MKTLPTLLSEIEYGDQLELHKNLPLLLEKIKKIINQIHNVKTYEEAETYFALLGQIQNILANLVFVKNFDVTSETLKFISDFERIDDVFLQEYLFKEIKNNRYNLKN